MITAVIARFSALPDPGRHDDDERHCAAFRRDIWFFLATRVPIIALAGVVLAVFTTARVAGPLVRLRRAFDLVKGGDMDQRIGFRRGDTHLRELGRSFNEMMETLSERTDSRGGLEADDESYSGTAV